LRRSRKFERRVVKLNPEQLSGEQQGHRSTPGSFRPRRPVPARAFRHSQFGGRSLIGDAEAEKCSASDRQRNALASVLDPSVSTPIVARILFFVGSGPVRGFAITPGAGILKLRSRSP